NKSVYPNNVIHKVDRTIDIWNSSDIRIVSSQIRSTGKEALMSYESRVNAENVKIECYYFCISAYHNSNILAFNSKFTLNHLQLIVDDHPAFYLSKSNLYLPNNQYEFVTGRSFVGGQNDPVNEIKVTGGTVIHPERMSNWLNTHPLTSGLRLFVTGDFSPLI